MSEGSWAQLVGVWARVEGSWPNQNLGGEGGGGTLVMGDPTATWSG